MRRKRIKVAGGGGWEGTDGQGAVIGGGREKESIIYRANIHLES